MPGDIAAIGTRWGLVGDQQQVLATLAAQLEGGQLSACEAWRELCGQLLRPEQPFELHQQLFDAVYAGWQQEQQRPPPPVWLPDSQQVAATNLARFMAAFQGDLAWEAGRTGDPVADLDLLHRVSCDDPDVFWAAVLKTLGVPFATPPSRILADNVAQPDAARWLPGARLNIAHAALHSPLAPRPEAPAVLWAAEGAPTQLQALSWAQLRERCDDWTAAIAATFQPGDALAIAMPLTLPALVLYLSTVAAGCVAVSIADSFSAAEVATRLRLSGAKAIFTQDVIVRGGKVLPLYARMLEAPGLPRAIVVQAAGSGTGASQQQQQQAGVALRPGDTWLHDFLAAPSSSSSSSRRPLPHIVDAAAPCNILFSSGTTGEPKAIPWSHTTPLRAAVNGWAHQNITPGAVVAWPTNLGWMMGPWLLFASLLNGATIALYEGAPLGRDFGEFVAASRVNVLGLVPSIVKAWRASGAMAHLDWSSIQCFSSTGEASSPEDYHWLASRVPGYRPVIEYCGGTEIGGAFLSGSLLQPQAPSTFSTPTLGARLVLLDSSGGQLVLPNRACTGATGEVAVMPPMLGASQALLHRDHAATYYQGMPASDVTGGPLRRHGDEIQVLPGGYYRALGRCDDTMNLGGIKVSSVELERTVLAAVPRVLEVAAVGIPAPGGGPELLHLFVVPAATAGADPAAAAAAADEEEAQLAIAAQGAIKASLNPLFKVHRVVLLRQLPRTASNKVMRRVLRDQVLAAAAGEGAPRPRL